MDRPLLARDHVLRDGARRRAVQRLGHADVDARPARVSEAIPSPSTIDPTIDPQLAEWIEWLLKKDPKERPETAQEGWDKLEEIVIHLLGPRWRREARLPEDVEHLRRRSRSR